jgi:predicted aspartyl protease
LPGGPAGVSPADCFGTVAIVPVGRDARPPHRRDAAGRLCYDAATLVDKVAARRRFTLTTMRRFFRSLRPLLVVVAIVIWISGRTQQAHSADSDPKFPIEIPMRVEGGMFAIELTVNGEGPFLFAIDTGAEGGPRLDSSLVEKLGLKPSGQMQEGDPSGRNPRMAETVKLDSIEVGGLRFTGIDATSRNYKNSPRPLAADGIIGLGLFPDYLVELDFPAKVLRISRGELPKADGAEILDYTSEHGIPSVELSAGNTKIKAHLDSGNMIGAFVFPTSFVEKLTQTSKPLVVGRARSASGEMEIKQVQIKEMVWLGRHEFPDPTVTFPALGDVGNVGAKILSQFAMTFDQPHQRVRLTRGDVGR